MPCTLPKFEYHPDPIGTGSVIPSGAVCDCCGQARGFIYDGLVHAERELEAVCPWCIASGAAHAKLGASFTDEAAIGGHGKWDKVPEAVIEAVAYRTPGYTGWQGEQWWTHCGDAGEFLGRFGTQELEALGPEAVAAIKDTAGLEGEELDLLMSTLDKDGSPTAYIFRCRHCGKLGGDWDCH